MTNQPNEFLPDWVSPPGDTILDLMEEKDWTQLELSQRLGISAKHLNQLVKGKVSLTFETAQRLERVLGSTVNFWMNRESRYREHLARIAAKKTYANWAGWLDNFQMAELKKVGIIEKGRLSATNTPKFVEDLLSFFGVATPDEWTSRYASMNAAFRRSNEDQANVGAIAAWLRLGEIEAERISAPKYNRAKFEGSLKMIRELTRQDVSDFEPELVKLCLNAGVKLVFVKAIRGARVSGVARWLNNHSPVIQLSLYGKSNDKFWFTFFHEAAHILLHADEKKAIFLDDIKFKSQAEEEVEANNWAKDILIPPKHRYDMLNLRSKEQILEFSERVNVHPGIVVGRLQHEGMIGFSSVLNRLKISLEVREDNVAS